MLTSKPDTGKGSPHIALLGYLPVPELNSPS
jgi:hypothetical protein